MRQALEYPFNKPEFIKYRNPDTWVDSNLEHPVTARDWADPTPASQRGSIRPDGFNRREDLGKPDPSLPRDAREQARLQKRVAGGTPPTTPREAKNCLLYTSDAADDM
eukprot:4595879-Alexandrium_andersonii.AAC.1